VIRQIIVVCIIVHRSLQVSHVRQSTTSKKSLTRH